MKTYRQIRQSLTEVGADREEDQNFKLGPEKMSPTPSDEDEYDELDDDIEDTHQEVEAIRPLYVRDKLGHYTTSDTWSSSGTMAQMTQQAATKNLQSEYVPEDGEVLDEDFPLNEIGDTPRGQRRLSDYVKGATHDLDINATVHGYKTGLRKAGRGPKEPSPLGGMKPAGPDDHERKLSRTRRNRRAGIGRAVNRLANKESVDSENETYAPGNTTRMPSPDFDERQGMFNSNYKRINKRNPTKAEMRAAGVGKGGDNPKGVKAWKAAMEKLKKGAWEKFENNEGVSEASSGSSKKEKKLSYKERMKILKDLDMQIGKKRGKK